MGRAGKDYQGKSKESEALEHHHPAQVAHLRGTVNLTP